MQARLRNASRSKCWRRGGLAPQVVRPWPRVRTGLRGSEPDAGRELRQGVRSRHSPSRTTSSAVFVQRRRERRRRSASRRGPMSASGSTERQPQPPMSPGPIPASRVPASPDVPASVPASGTPASCSGPPSLEPASLGPASLAPASIPPSPHDGSGTRTQTPVVGSQASSVQAFPSSQLRAVPRQALPMSQTSSSVHALPSSQGHRSPEKGSGPEYEQIPNPPSASPASTLQNCRVH